MCHTCNKTFKNKALFDSHQNYHDVQQIFQSSLQTAVGVGHPNIMQAPHMNIPTGLEGPNNPICVPHSTAGYMQSPPPPPLQQQQPPPPPPPPKVEQREAEPPAPPATTEKKKPPPSGKPRIFGCDLCDKAYTRRDHLNRHRLVHGGVRDHVCSVCNKEFYRKDKLRRHEQTHLKLKDLSLFCRVCGKQCQRKDSLTRHEKTHDKECTAE